MSKGYFEIGILNGKTPANLGTLWRSAYQLGASGIFTIGHRYSTQPSDTTKTYRHIPLRQFETFKQFQDARPYDCFLVGVEMGGEPLGDFKHPARAIYLLGAEDHGLSRDAINSSQYLVSLETIRTESFNVSVAGSIVMYDRLNKGK